MPCRWHWQTISYIASGHGPEDGYHVLCRCAKSLLRYRLTSCLAASPSDSFAHCRQTCIQNSFLEVYSDDDVCQIWWWLEKNSYNLKKIKNSKKQKTKNSFWQNSWWWKLGYVELTPNNDMIFIYIFIIIFIFIITKWPEDK